MKKTSSSLDFASLPASDEEIVQQVESTQKPGLALQSYDNTPIAYQAVRGGVWVTLSSYWMTGFGFIANILLTRQLSPEVYGQFALAMFFAMQARLLPRLGASLGTAFARHKETSGKVYGTYFAGETLMTALTLPLAIGAMIFLPRLGYSDAVASLGVILILSLTFEGFAGMGNTLLDKEMQFGRSSLVRSITFPISYVPAFWLATQGGGVWSLIAQNITYNILTLIGMGCTVYRHLPQLRAERWQFDIALAKQFFRFGLAMGLTSYVSNLLTRLDNFFIGTFVGETELGFYDRAYRMTEWPALLLNALLTRTAFLTYAHLQNDVIRLNKTVSIVTWLIVITTFPVMLIFIIAASDLILLLYGEKWLASAPFLQVLMLYAALRPLWINASNVFMAIGKVKSILKYNLLQLVVLGILGVILTWLWGAMGTCIAVGIGLLISMFFAYRDIFCKIPIVLLTVLFLPALAAALTLLGYLILNYYADLNNLPLILRVFAKTFYAAVTFFTLLFALNPRATQQRVRYIWQLAMQAR